MVPGFDNLNESLDEGVSIFAKFDDNSGVKDGGGGGGGGAEAAWTLPILIGFFLNG